MMFESMSSFLWFFIPSLLAICAGIVWEEKLIEFENKIARVFLAIVRTIKEAMQ